MITPQDEWIAALAVTAVVNMKITADLKRKIKEIKDKSNDKKESDK